MPPMKPEARQRNARLRCRRAVAQTPARAARPPDRPARSTVPSRGRWPSAACSASARRRVRPTLPNYFYNNLKQIVQTPGHRADPERDGARRARRPHERASTCRRPSAGGWAIRSAHWEGDTLVVDTTNFTEQDAVQRIERSAARRRALHARRRRRRSSIASPSRIRRPGIARGPASTRGGRPTKLYEYACHEGNYAMGTCCGARGRRKPRTPRRNRSSAALGPDRRLKISALAPGRRLVLPGRIVFSYPVEDPHRTSGDLRGHHVQGGRYLTASRRRFEPL